RASNEPPFFPMSTRSCAVQTPDDLPVEQPTLLCKALNCSISSDLPDQQVHGPLCETAVHMDRCARCDRTARRSDFRTRCVAYGKSIPSACNWHAGLPGDCVIRARWRG